MPSGCCRMDVTCSVTIGDITVVVDADAWSEEEVDDAVPEEK